MFDPDEESDEEAADSELTENTEPVLQEGRARSFAAIIAGLMAAMGLLAGGGILGVPGGEVFGHAWVQWWHADALPSWPGGTDLAIGTDQWPVIDPLPTFLAAVLGRLFGVAVGYNLLIVAFVALAFHGGAALAERDGGSPWVGGLVVCLSPIFLGSLSSGLTEDGALGLAALALAYLGRPNLRDGLKAGLCLGLLSWCGLVLAWATAIVCVGLGLVCARHDRRALRPLLAGAGVALSMAIPAAWAQGGRLGGEGHRQGELLRDGEPLWFLNPWKGADLMSFFSPGRVEIGDQLVRWHPAYLGFVALALAFYGSRDPKGHPPRGRGAWWWVLVLSAAAAVGSEPMLAGNPVPLPNPVAGLVHLLPFGDLVNHHARLLLPGTLALAVLAARGATRLEGSRRFGASGSVWVALALGVEMLLLAPLSYPLPVASIRVPEVLRSCDERRVDGPCVDLDDLTPGRMLVVPMGGPGVHPQRPLIDQRAHGRTLFLDPNRPGWPRGEAYSPTSQWLLGLAVEDGVPPPSVFDVPQGVSVLLVMAPYDEEVSDLLGPPDVRAADGSAWDLVRWIPTRREPGVLLDL